MLYVNCSLFIWASFLFLFRVLSLEFHKANESCDEEDEYLEQNETFSIATDAFCRRPTCVTIG